MLTKPDIADELIISRLQSEYDLRVSTLTFLPLGADMGTVVYRVIDEEGFAYFLKLRKGFNEFSVSIPILLMIQGIKEVIVPFETISSQGWADFGEYMMILYPFIEGKNGFEMVLSDSHKRTLGAALKGIHSAQIPPEPKKQIPQETYSSKYRESMKSFQLQVESQTYDEPVAKKLAEFIKSKRDVISHIIARAEALASKLRSKSLEFVLCHTDFHGGNFLIGKDKLVPIPAENLYIVDWDAPLLAPKERDLMFIGGGIDEIWKTKQDEALFYEGYGKTEINIAVLAYYRFERIIVDLVEFCNQLLLSEEGGADREQAYRWFTSNFEAGSTIEIAHKTDTLGNGSKQI